MADVRRHMQAFTRVARLVREGRGEDLVQQTGIDPATGVTDLHHDPPVLRPVHAQREAALFELFNWSASRALTMMLMSALVRRWSVRRSGTPSN